MAKSTRPTTAQIMHRDLRLDTFLDRTYSRVFPEDFGAIGDGVTDDTVAVRKWIEACANGRYIGAVTLGKTYTHNKITVSGLSDITLMCYGAKFKNIGGQTGAIFYTGCAMLNFVAPCTRIHIYGLEQDGNRDGSPEYKGGNHGVQFTTQLGDFRTNNGGIDKPIKDIKMVDCFQYELGSFKEDADKYGDGIYLYGVDGFYISRCRFKDVGRWGVAVSDCLNGEICYSVCDNRKEGSVALGFIDVENESLDQTWGTFSENIHIHDNIGYGYCQILVGGGSYGEGAEGNDRGLYHHLRNVVVENNYLVVEGGSHAYPAYTTNLIFLGCAPFCKKQPTGTPVQNTGIYFRGNTVIHKMPGNLSIGIGINAQGIGGTNVVSDIVFEDNVVEGFYKPVQVAGTTGASGYTFSRIKVIRNTLTCDPSNSIGVRIAAVQLVDCQVAYNIINGSSFRAVSIEEDTSIVATDGYVMVHSNRIRNSSGTCVLANCYKLSLVGNEAEVLVNELSGVKNIIKDHSNSWNTFKRTINSATIQPNSKHAQGAIDLGGGHITAGYMVTAAPPSVMGHTVWSAQVSGAGQGLLVIYNNDSGAATINQGDWTFNCSKP